MFKRFEFLCSKSFVLRNGRTSCPSLQSREKALIMLFRDEMGEDTSTEDKPGCGSVISVMAGLPLLALGASVLFKRKKD